MKKFFIPLGLLIILLVCVWWLFSVAETQPQTPNFEECVRAGNPVMESYPRQCRDAKGELFVEIPTDTGPAWNDGTCRQIPHFDFYSIEKEDVSTAPVNFSTAPEAKKFGTAIKNALNDGINFAGHYIVAEWGCGTGCQNHAVIDAKTGSIVHYGLPSEYGAMRFATSTLLVLNNPQDEIAEQHKNLPTEFYEMKDGQLSFLCRLPIE